MPIVTHKYKNCHYYRVQLASKTTAELPIRLEYHYIIPLVLRKTNSPYQNTVVQLLATSHSVRLMQSLDQSQKLFRNGRGSSRFVSLLFVILLRLYSSDSLSDKRPRARQGVKKKKKWRFKYVVNQGRN